MANGCARRWAVGAVVLLLVVAAGCAPRVKPAEAPEIPTVLSNIPIGQWVSFFDGKTLTGWKVIAEGEFDMHGKIEVKAGAMALGVGMPFSAVRWTGDFPKENFEVECEAMRTTGVDIFCGLTFPVGSSQVSLVLGGWGDTVVGISCIDDLNASENETAKVMSFDNNKWVRVRARVTEKRVEAWVNDEQVVDVERKGRRFSLYPGLDPIAPFGVFSWQTESKLRKFRIRRLKGSPKKPPKALPPLPQAQWKPLFDGKGLGGWAVAEESEFAMHGKIYASDGKLFLGKGDPMSGVVWGREFPRTNYELALDAMRVEGDDFFCGLTFPVAKAQCSLIVGGWGGSVVGLSNVDDLHAAENKTTRSMHLDRNEWYRIRLRVTPAKIEAWIDTDKVIDLATKGRKLTIWPQQKPMTPLGISAYYTEAVLRNIQYRTLPDAS